MTNVKREHLKVLFIHHNSPAQFKYLIPLLRERNAEIVFISEFISMQQKGCEHIQVKKEKLEKQGVLIDDYNTALAFKEEFTKLRTRGTYPDIIISHTGWGVGLCAKSVFSKSKLISYSEWWFKQKNPLHDTRNVFFQVEKEDKMATKRNAFVGLQLIDSDKIVCPTKWQQKQLPPDFLFKTEIVYDPVPFEDYSNIVKQGTDNLVNSKKYITYGTRGLEPIRYFPEFVKAASEALKRSKDIVFEVLGEDKIHYGGGIKSHKNRFL